MTEKPGSGVESESSNNKSGSSGKESPAEIGARLQAEQEAIMAEPKKPNKEADDERSQWIQQKKKKHRRRRAEQHRN